MLSDRQSPGQRLRRRLLRQVSQGMRSNPALTLTLITVAAVAVAATAAFFVLAAVAAALIAAVLVVGFAAATELIQPHRAGTHRPPVGVESSEECLATLLAAIEDCLRLTALAEDASLEVRARGRRSRQAERQAGRLRDVARRLARSWRAAGQVDECIRELEASCTALESFFGELRRGKDQRLSTASLRWRQEDLSRRRDKLVARLRGADFRDAGASARPTRA